MDKAEQPTITQPLLPCPFCGEVCATLIIDQGDKWAHYEPGCLEVRTGYDISLDAPWRAEAIAAWNTRTPSLAAQVDALRQTRDALRKLQPALNVIAREIIDDIIADNIEKALP